MEENLLLFHLKWKETTDMDIESLKENFTKKITIYKAQLEDNEIYSRLLEGYENLSPTVQKFISYSFLLFIIYGIYSFPSSYIVESKEKLEIFEENRKLTKDMIRAGHIEKTLPTPPASLSTSQLKSEVKNKIKAQQIITEQQKETSVLSKVSNPSLLPKKVKQTGLQINIEKLNLKQLVRLGEAFDSIKGARLMNMTIEADKKEPHYFNVQYEVAGFSVSKIKSKKKEKKKSRLKRKSK